jgi:hypothetical protein
MVFCELVNGIAHLIGFLWWVCSEDTIKSLDFVSLQVIYICMIGILYCGYVLFWNNQPTKGHHISIRRNQYPKKSCIKNDKKKGGRGRCRAGKTISRTPSPNHPNQKINKT